jgi:hypothetical protein
MTMPGLAHNSAIGALRASGVVPLSGAGACVGVDTVVEVADVDCLLATDALEMMAVPMGSEPVSAPWRRLAHTGCRFRR